MWVQVSVLGVVISGLVSGESETVIFPRLKNNVDYTDNKKCWEQNKLYQDSLENLTLWAHEMWDASAKYTTGVLRGSIYQFGDWDECITVAGPYRTRYCLAILAANVPELNSPRDPISLYHSPFESVLNRIYATEDPSQASRQVVHVGLCVPAACQPGDLEHSLKEHLAKEENPLADKNVTYSVTVPDKLCQTEAEIGVIDSLDIAFCSLTLLIIILMILSTIYDVSQNNKIEMEKTCQKRSITSKICLAFSVRKNFLELSRADTSNPALSILDGLKTFSVLIIVVAHGNILLFVSAVFNVDYIERGYRSSAAIFLLRGDLFVDTFFLLSGLLVTYTLMKQFNKKLINPLFIIFWRYMRLTPAYAFVILFYTSMFNHAGSGPMWKTIIGGEVEFCRENWWTNLLYVSNYVNDEGLCIIQSWYLPCDFHFFIVGVFVTMVLSRHKRTGLALLAFLLVLSVATPFTITVLLQREAFHRFYLSTLSRTRPLLDWRTTYTKSHTRAAPYVIGMVVGYVYYRLRDGSKRMSRVKSHVLTLCSLLVLYTSLSTGNVFYNPYHQYNALEAGFYASLHRVVWALGTVGLLFSASFGHATFLKSALSWSPWVPLGKLVYSVYLVHMIFAYRYAGNATSPRHFNLLDVMTLLLGITMLSFATALFLYLGVETPIRKISKELLKLPMSSDKKIVTLPNTEGSTEKPQHNDSRL